MKIALRPVTSDDREFLIALYASTRAEELAPVPWSDQQKADFLRVQFQAQDSQYAGYPNTDYRVIIADDERAGRLYLSRMSEEIRVVDIALLPAFRGHGIGERLLREVLTEARSRGLPVRIHVERDNRAWRLYKRLGFVEIADKGIYAFLEASGL